MEFRRRFLLTLEAIQPVLDEAGVLVVGSEVPNLLQADAAATLVVSQYVDVAVPVEAHRGVKQRLHGLQGFHRSADEPSVWLPEKAELIEVNFIGRDSSLQDPSDTYLLDDAELPLLVFGAL